MSKGHRNRSKDDYEREIEEAAKRMKKYPEHLRSARTSPEWKQFLLDIGIEPKIVSSDSGRDFWEQVRSRVSEKEIGFTTRQLAEANAEYEPLGRGSQFRSKETGRFVSKKSLKN